MNLVLSMSSASVLSSLERLSVVFCVPLGDHVPPLFCIAWSLLGLLVGLWPASEMSAGCLDKGGSPRISG